MYETGLACEMLARPLRGRIRMLIRLGCSHTVGAAESVSLHLAAGHSVVAAPPWRADQAGRGGPQTAASQP